MTTTPGSTTSFTSVPILDLAQANDPAAKPNLLKQLRFALTEIGFLYIKNHGVPSEIISDLVHTMSNMFDLSQVEKSRVALENSPHFLGYSGEGSETTGGRTDNREQYEFATELEDRWTEGMPLYERLKGPCQYPATSPPSQPIIESYISHITTLSTNFLTLVAQCLDLPPLTFHSYLSNQHRLKLVHYPPSSTPSQGVGPHKDSSGWFTFLLQASPSIGGLQALNKAGQWIDIPAIPDTFVVNIGQAFEVITHGVCKATTHRVLSQTAERYSVPFFQGVRLDLTKREALDGLRTHFETWESRGGESAEGREIDSAFLQGRYDTWGESQLRTKIRSHRGVGRKFYADVYERYVNED
ncbi:gibberellin 2-beta-dioxygenase [Pseudovirgaria hyperparasitica]|uniref:Gibberellin 2-beta-dioxygenase n=1 Tax=Pseudovirgaria hyperparasitica TaxID=470096 RepID=A0A6A6W7M7_9PEZI|nr:gibberellin 2-beta-dioxygenase [Pseudovirgaria hyperparasitica]KAF2757960.1 gibberellin 2-beta-dioxygenase [Pseudovirgaria hyperparasitica]